MPDSSADRDALEVLAEEFVTRFRSGERPSLSDYAWRLPDRAEEVRDLFPTLVEMEQLKPVAADHSGDHRSAVESADPQRVGEFGILRRVGVGGMGAVYEAVQESLGRHVALKLLPADALADPRRLDASAARPRPPLDCTTPTSCPCSAPGGRRPALLRHSVHRRSPVGRRDRRAATAHVELRRTRHARGVRGSGVPQDRDLCSSAG